MSGQIALFSATAATPLADAICAELGITRSPLHRTRFSNDCLEIQLAESCRDRDVFVVAPIAPPTDESLIELLLILDAARAASAGRIIAVLPHYAYARSDKMDHPRVSIGGKLVARLIATSGANRVLAVALHSPQVHGFFDVPLDHLSALPTLAAHFAHADLTNTVVVSPDLGNIKQSTEFADMLGLGVAAAIKRRLADDRVAISSIVGDVAGRNVIILDDEIATGGSVVELVTHLQDLGVGTIDVACTHGLFTHGALDKISAFDAVRSIVTTDTVPQQPAQKLQVVSLAGLLAQAIDRIHQGTSVSALSTPT
jgi:ribose-phosphate pyrophosphokinase